MPSSACGLDARFSSTHGATMTNDYEPELPSSADVVVVGAGLAGLSAARALHERR
ncbi:MAG: FAD-binding protein [Acidimicrobiales bacterium]